jgi:hypothetical protein
MGQRTNSICSTVDQIDIRGFDRMTLIRPGATSVSKGARGLKACIDLVEDSPYRGSRSSAGRCDSSP